MKNILNNFFSAHGNLFLLLSVQAILGRKGLFNGWENSRGFLLGRNSVWVQYEFLPYLYLDCDYASGVPGSVPEAGSVRRVDKGLSELSGILRNSESHDTDSVLRAAGPRMRDEPCAQGRALWEPRPWPESWAVSDAWKWSRARAGHLLRLCIKQELSGRIAKLMDKYK